MKPTTLSPGLTFCRPRPSPINNINIVNIGVNQNHFGAILREYCTKRQSCFLISETVRGVTLLKKNTQIRYTINANLAASAFISIVHVYIIEETHSFNVHHHTLNYGGRKTNIH